MGVSLYYQARRSTPPTEAEATEVARIAAAHQASFPYEDEESLYLYGDDGRDPDEILAGSTKLPLAPDRLLPVTTHVLASVTDLRRALPDAEWRVHIDDVDIPWDGDEGYALPGTRA
ncbi:hypothetical protein [Streptomyces sparsogenes]|uniref:Uncharacterized protein n=1 Tax=Streptomyces sparsogenes DSM 40356 TaxID=1331668 RepID=A0A1R1SLJ5_9ACTN|nr:hypothetical protein [Streptomyces sparsogenes]OMI39181.1 hypothetical protein SPAR_12225 [Streptomyces sparsogenes DSM 40356]